MKKVSLEALNANDEKTVERTDVAISRLERSRHRSLRDIGRTLVHAKAKHGHFDARIA